MNDNDDSKEEKIDGGASPTSPEIEKLRKEYEQRMEELEYRVRMLEIDVVYFWGRDSPTG